MSEITSMGIHLNTTPDRINAIVRIVLDFFANTPVEDLQQRVPKELGHVTAGEFAYAEQMLSSHGISDDDFHGNVEEFIGIFKQSLSRGELPPLPEGHPITIDLAENREILKLVANLQSAREDVKGTYEKLMQVSVHYTRKENQLFPLLEAKGFDKPSKVMWTMHDEIRKAIKVCRKLVLDDQTDQLSKMEPKMLKAVVGMVFKEEKILLPTALEMLSDQEWAQVARGSEEVGYCLIEEPQAWRSADENEPASPLEGENASNFTPPIPFSGPVSRSSAVGAINLDEGFLTPEQINLMLGHLPVDLTFVDEFDEVKYYNKAANRVFPRSAGIIGRKVKYCHPPKSVHIVEEIVDAFKSGEKSVADFWIQMKGHFLYIRYFAVRDGEGNYKGVIEVTQEVSGIKALEGERRLLDWGEPQKEKS
jgi:DUF438 domain-containing protein